MKKYAFLVSFCDTYEDLWDTFFECLDQMINENGISFYLNTEHKQFISN